MGRPFALVSVGAIAPSIEQYAGAFSVAATHRGAARVTPATGSPMDETGMAPPIFSGVQSAIETTRGAGVCAVCHRSPAGAPEHISADVRTMVPVRIRFPRFIVLS